MTSNTYIQKGRYIIYIDLILPYLARLFERIHKQIDSFMENQVSSYLYGFRKKSQCAILAFKNNQKLEKAIRQW